MKKIIFILSVLVGIQACTKDFIEVAPMVNKLESNSYLTEEDAFLAVTSVYDGLSVQNWGTGPIAYDIFSDDAFTGGTAGGSDMGQWQDIEKWTPTIENSSSLATWNKCYSGIYRANLFLEKVEGIKWSKAETKNRMVGETKFLRAYYYWDLERHFGWVPLVLNIYPVEEYKKFKQVEPKEVYKQVVTDLLEAIQYCPKTLPSTEIGRVTRYTAQSLLARIYLFYNGYAKNVLGVTGELTNNDGSVVIDKTYIQAAIKEVIESKSYDLLPSYAAQFDWANDQNTIENVFSWQYDGKSLTGDWGGWYMNGNLMAVMYGIRSPVENVKGVVDAGWSYAVPTWSLVNEFLVDNDPRLKVTVYNANDSLKSYTAGFQNTGYFNSKFMCITKYRAASNTAQNYPINYPDIRFADVLLMASEIFLNDDVAYAQKCFDRVRKRAWGDAAVMPAVTLDVIYHERRVELSGEGQRYWDLLRRGLDYTEQKINASFNNIPTGKNIKAADFAVPRYFKKETFGLLPIPGSEIRLSGGNLKQFVPAYQ